MLAKRSRKVFFCWLGSCNILLMKIFISATAVWAPTRGELEQARVPLENTGKLITFVPGPSQPGVLAAELKWFSQLGLRTPLLCAVRRWTRPDPPLDILSRSLNFADRLFKCKAYRHLGKNHIGSREKVRFRGAQQASRGAATPDNTKGLIKCKWPLPTFDLILSHILCRWQQPSRYLVLGCSTMKNTHTHNAFGLRSNTIGIDSCLFLQQKPRLCVLTTQLRPYNDNKLTEKHFLIFISKVIWSKLSKTNGQANKQTVRTEFSQFHPEKQLSQFWERRVAWSLNETQSEERYVELKSLTGSPRKSRHSN